MIDAAMQNALERIAARANDVQRAFTPGAVPQFGDAGAAPSSRPTFDPLSVAPPPDAYFITAGERGRPAYTQDGGFTLRDGVLGDRNGRAVLGFTGEATSAEELHCDPVDVALGRVMNPRIDADGTLAYDRASIDPRSGAREVERVTVGRIALARFPAGTRLGAAGVVPHVGRPSDGNFAAVDPMRQENSRIDFDRSLDRLEEAYMSFDALQAAHKARGAFGKTAMDLLK